MTSQKENDEYAGTDQVSSGKRRLLTIQAALRFWQQNTDEDERIDIDIRFTSKGMHSPLSNAEIDELCEHLTTSKLLWEVLEGEETKYTITRRGVPQSTHLAFVHTLEELLSNYVKDNFEVRIARIDP